MGGNALKNTVTRRYFADEYHALVPEVLKKLSNSIRMGYCQVIPAYRNKESFGDMDILYCTTRNIPYEEDLVKRLFSPNEIIKNGEVISFDYKELQIDIIHIEDTRFNYALNYFSWNDCGNLVGKLTHRLGLKHGHKGLFLPLREDNNVFSEVLINRSHRETLKLVGLEPGVYDKGFDTLEEMFEFIATSPYYHPDQYKLENLNTIGRVRDRKRDTYRKFLEFGERQDRTNYAQYEHRSDKTGYLPLIFRTFPEAKPLFEEEMKNVAMQRMVKEKFNGDLVSELTGLLNKDLGKFMVHLKTTCYWTDPSYLVYLSTDWIKIAIVTEFKNYTEAKNVIYTDYS